MSITDMPRLLLTVEPSGSVPVHVFAQCRSLQFVHVAPQFVDLCRTQVVMPDFPRQAHHIFF
jgi:hypothetical protein